MTVVRKVSWPLSDLYFLTLDELLRGAKRKKKRIAIQLTDIATIDRSGTSMLTNSKGIILIHLKKRGRKSGLPST
jgi:hypothetical protein